MEHRDYKIDNIRFLLILLTICGHFIELFDKTLESYKIIYSFHMPAFVFLSGLYADFDRKKLLKRLIFPYFVFQTLYLIFNSIVFSHTLIDLQYTTPYWILWYLLTMIFYHLILPYLPQKNTRNAVIVLIAAICLSLAVGYDTSVGYYMSLSRTVVFSPFFLAGYYFPCIKSLPPIRYIFEHRRFIFIFGAAAILGSQYIINVNFPVRLFYGSYSYITSGGSITQRLILICIALIWIVFLLLIFPRKKIPFITVLGQNTMPVFLFHALFIKLAEKHDIFQYDMAGNLFLTLLLSLLIIVAFGNPITGRIFKRFF